MGGCKSKDQHVLDCESLIVEDKCAKENKRSKKCVAKRGKDVRRGKHLKDECCDGLVCHEYQWWKCIKEENKSCAGPNTLVGECGSDWGKATPECCPGLVCNSKKK